MDRIPLDRQYCGSECLGAAESSTLISRNAHSVRENVAYADDNDNPDFCDPMIMAEVGVTSARDD
jgi:hypothetical protein